MTGHKLPDWEEILYRLFQLPPHVMNRVAGQLRTWSDSEKHLALEVLDQFETTRNAADRAGNVAAIRFEARARSGEFSAVLDPKARQALAEVISEVFAEEMSREDDAGVVQSFLALEGRWTDLPPHIKARFPWPGPSQQ